MKAICKRVMSLLFFDLEFYVPKEDRGYSGRNLRFNPCRDGNMILGGCFDLRNEEMDPLEYRELWFWNYKDRGGERGLLEDINSIFKGYWNQALQGGSQVRPVGTGITRTDLPALYARSVYLDVDTAERLFTTYLTGFPLDLTVVAAGFLKPSRNHPNLVEPKRTHNLLRYFKIALEKETGNSVWDLFDNQEFYKIEERTRLEVEQNVKIYSKIVEKLNSKGRKKRQ